MDIQVLCIISALTTLLIVLTDAQNPQIIPNQQPDPNVPIQMNQQRTQGSRFRDKQHVQDKDHIMEHLEDVIDKPESEMTEAELQLHYFKMHDYDNNNKLDGLELIQALTHYHHDDEEEEEEKKDMTETELIALIDPIFADEDENGDGYIDYPEFAKTQS